jgi:hypothetical protein
MIMRHTEAAIFVKSHVKKWLFSLGRGVLQACILYNKLVVEDTGLQSRWAAALRAALRHAFHVWIGEFWKLQNGKWQRYLILMSSKVGTMKRGSLQRSSVLPTRPVKLKLSVTSESNSNVNLFFHQALGTGWNQGVAKAIRAVVAVRVFWQTSMCWAQNPPQMAGKQELWTGIPTVIQHPRVHCGGPPRGRWDDNNGILLTKNGVSDNQKYELVYISMYFDMDCVQWLY